MYQGILMVKDKNREDVNNITIAVKKENGLQIGKL